MHKITQRWGENLTRWVVELCFEDLFNWNTWMWAERTVMVPGTSLRMLSWGSNMYTFAPDGPTDPYSFTPPVLQHATSGGGGAAALESGLDNGPMYGGSPFNLSNATGRGVLEQFDAGYTGMYLMDCLAQIKLAKMIGRDDAAAVLQSRFDIVNEAMLSTLWSKEEGFFQNYRAVLKEKFAPMGMMAPTNFYPLLAGPVNGPSESQATDTVLKHLTNATRFSVWPTPQVPDDPHRAPPPDQARPLVQWFSAKDGRGFPLQGSPHQLCSTLMCSQNQWKPGSYIQRIHSTIRIEGIGLVTLPPKHADGSNRSQLVPLYDYVCSNTTATAAVTTAGTESGIHDRDALDHAMGPAGWKPSYGGPCTRVIGHENTPSLYVYADKTRGPTSNLIALEMWYMSSLLPSFTHHLTPLPTHLVQVVFWAGLTGTCTALAENT